MSDEKKAPKKPMRHYTYFALTPQGMVAPLPLQAVSDREPPPEAVEAMYMQMVKQMGIGAPRPTHVAVVELKELPPRTADAETPPTIIVPSARNGGTRER